MAKRKNKNAKKKIIPLSNQQNRDQSNYQRVFNELYGHRVRYSHDQIATKKSLYDLKKECVNLSVYISALLDLLVDISGIPSQKLVGRFMQYCDEKQVVDGAGQVRGNVLVNKYNF